MIAAPDARERKEGSAKLALEIVHCTAEAGVQRRSSSGAAAVHQRCISGASAVQQRCISGAAAVQQRCSSKQKLTQIPLIRVLGVVCLLLLSVGQVAKCREEFRCMFHLCEGLGEQTTEELSTSLEPFRVSLPIYLIIKTAQLS